MNSSCGARSAWGIAAFISVCLLLFYGAARTQRSIAFDQPAKVEGHIIGTAAAANRHHDDESGTLTTAQASPQSFAVAFGNRSKLGHGSAQACARRFYMWSFAEFENTFPHLAQCHLTTYASIVQATAMKDPCRTTVASEAEIVMAPPYLAQECNWPAYGGGYCQSVANTYRHGALCSIEVLQAIAWVESLRDNASGSEKILLVDQNPSWTPYLLPEVEYGKAGRIWAKVNSMPPFYRPGTDISMPPAATDRCRMTPASAYEEPLESKRFFVSFKGQLTTTIRQAVARLFNNGRDCVIADSNDHGFDYDELLQSSRFNLILGGHIEFSYRFNEAVCSGGVPVLVTNKWVPPFNEFLPFNSYGVLIRERAISNMMNILKALSDDEVEMLRANARRNCQYAFQTTEASVLALMHHVAGIKPHASDLAR